jgi:UDP-glucose 4-epimerase
MNGYLITGGCGFIGVNLVARLAKQGARIRVLDNLSQGRAEDIEPFGVELLVGDILDRDLVAQATRGVEVVIHLAAHTRVVDSIQDPLHNFKVNAEGTLNLLHASYRAGARKFIFASTGAAILGTAEPPVHEGMVPQPISPYGASKLAGEGYCSAFHGAFGLHTVALRFSNVYGPFSYRKASVIAHFLKNLLQRQPLVIYGDGSQTRDFLYVDDLVSAILLAEEKDAPGESFQIASGKETSISKLLDLIRELPLPFVPEVRYDQRRAGEVYRNFASIEKAKRVLGYRPEIELREGLVRTWEWFVSRQAAGAALPDLR